jgi:type III restriction enzyme
MSAFEVNEPILNSPFEEPQRHWELKEGQPAKLVEARRKAIYYYRDPGENSAGEEGSVGTEAELTLVNEIRGRVKAWRQAGYPNVTRTTLELLQWWRRDGRERRLFYAQLEAAETVIFLNEARADFLQGIEVPRDEPSEDRKAEGYAGFLRFACKMATGSGKTTVMGMLAAWSILNKVNNKSDARFSDTILVVCPSVTIRSRLQELNPENADASVYRTRDLVPVELMPQLRHGRVVITNWHVFEPQVVQAGGTSAKVVKAGRPVRVREEVIIGPKTTTARGKRYLSLKDYETQLLTSKLTVVAEERDETGHLKKVVVESTKYIESDTALVQRVLGREVGGKQNILVFNDEAHHAYRIRTAADGDDEDEEEREDEEYEQQEATVWIDGLDRVQKLRGINFCVDLSATPYYLNRVGQDANRPFPWVVSDFALVEAIEAGLVKIPQMAVRDTTGSEIPGYFNIWHWILPKLTQAERGGKKANPKPEAILKYAHHPISILGGQWEETLREWAKGDESRPPVFIVVAKNTKLAKLLYEWMGEGKAPAGIPPANIAGFRNSDAVNYTIRVDSKVVHETDTEGAKGDESRWMRFTLDTVGKRVWPADSQARPIYPEGFEELAKKLNRPLHPPGRDVRCIISVGMLTEGWDCNTVTHIIGLRPFMSQLLCEQVVGRGLRRASYDLTEKGRFAEEVASIFGAPFAVIPMKTSKGGSAPKEKRHQVRAIPEKAGFEIQFPRVEGYTQAIRNRIAANWSDVPSVVIEPGRIPPEVEMKAALLNNQGRMTLSGPGKISDVTLKEFRAKRRVQELVFELAATLTRDYVGQQRCEIPAHVLFPQIVPIVQKCLAKKVEVRSPSDVKDAFLAPYFGWIIERLLQVIGPDASQGETPEIPRYETSRGPGSTAEVDFWTSREVREIVKSHLNYVVADTKVWEESAAYFIDHHPAVLAFVKNSGLGFSIPYLHNGEPHDYVPDFIIRLSADPPLHLILEVKGYDPLEGVKRDAAIRWVNAVNADGRYGRWKYVVAKRPSEIDAQIEAVAQAGDIVSTV